MSRSNPITPPLLRSYDSLGFLGDSWIELTNNLIQSCPDRVTPPLPFSSGEEYLRLLKEAQKESNPSSHVASRRDSPKQGSPKSPPNSPNPEPSNTTDELKGVYINHHGGHRSSKSDFEDKESQNEWIWQWDSRPDQLPPKDWKFEHPEHGHSNLVSPIPIRREPAQMTYSMRLARVGSKSLFSKEVLYSLVISNVLSILLGAGIGVWLSKRGFIFTRLSIE